VAVLLVGTMSAFGQAPSANFTANVTSGCAPLTVTFTDQSSGNPTSWNWEFSNGTLSSAQNPVVSFATPGTYSVKLVVQNANGISEIERIDYITVFPSPTANFASNLTLGCVPTTIQFTDQSTTPVGSIVGWEWDFGDGGTSTAQNPSHLYNNVGFYTVTLTVTSSTGCRTTISRGSYIRILGSIATNFEASQPSTCQAPFSVNFTNQSSGPGNISYTWDFGNSQTSTAVNPSTIYNTPGTYNVTLNAVSDLGCTGTITQSITITSVSTDFNAPANICLNQPVTFQNNSSAPIMSANWDFGDGTSTAQVNPVKTFLTPGTYTVKLINQYESCTDSAFKTITVNDKPIVDFIVDDSASCQAPFTVQFTDLTAGAASWQWDFGDGGTSTAQNPSHTYAAVGNYNVTLTVTTAAGCSNSIVKPSYINIQPTAVSLNLPQGGCAPFDYTAYANIFTLDSIVSYLWDFGDAGATSTLRNPPPHTYNNPGVYTPSLTIVTASGCTTTASSVGGIRTGVRPTVNFTFAPSNTCASDTIQFTDLSTTTPGAEVTWTWDFGDGGFSADQNPQHVFQDTGLLTVKLIVGNDRCRDSLEQQIRVIPPVARFYYTVNCVTQQITFRDTSLVDPTITPITYLWDFGNGNTSNVQHPPPVTYAPGSYTVTLTVTNGPCSYQTTQLVILANEPADFSINRNPVCKNETFTLTAINSNQANISEYQWTIGTTVITGTTPSLSHSLPAIGTYDVTLRITDVNGCVTTKTVPNFITVNGPTANFAPATPGACLNKATTFNDLSTPAGSIQSWSFNFGDGAQQTFTAPPFTHVYSQLGGYSVSMTVTDAAGCTDTYALPVDILVTNPVVGFKADTFYCPQAPLQFVDTSAGAGLTYLWSFGDGNTSTLQNPQNSYPAGDNDYTVKLVITDISGCMDSVTKPNYIKIRFPKPAFDIRNTISICPPLSTSFTFQGSDYESFYWEFGDGGLSTLPNPTYFYSNYGTFIPTLYLQGPGGCVASVTDTVRLYNPFTSQINYGPITTACNSLNVDFNLVTPPGFKFIFYFGDGTADSTQRLNFSHFYDRPSFNTPSMLILDSISGCQVGIVGNPRIDVLGAVPLFGKDIEEFCDNGPVVFRDFTTKNEPIISTLWTFGDGGTSSATDPTHVYTQPGTYEVTLNITTQSNCSSSYKDTVYVYRTPIPIISGKDTVCVGFSEPYSGSTAVPDTLTDWLWSFANQTSTQQNINVTYNTTGEQTIQLITTNKLGCSDTTTKTVFVTPPPTAVAVQDPLTILVGSSAPLAMTYTGDITSWTWTPAIRLSCTNCPVPLANPQFNTKYQVQVEDRFGCRNTGSITVQVVCTNQNFFIPNTFSPNGDGQNEAFFPRGSGLYNVKSMIIFNRWGQVVFERKNFAVNDANYGWNGMFQGQKASADVYIYMIEILCENGMLIPIKGNVTLLR
jgi:gliding motility-associated-like protein